MQTRTATTKEFETSLKQVNEKHALLFKELAKGVKQMKLQKSLATTWIQSEGADVNEEDEVKFYDSNTGELSGTVPLDLLMPLLQRIWDECEAENG